MSWLFFLVVEEFDPVFLSFVVDDVEPVFEVFAKFEDFEVSFFGDGVGFFVCHWWSCFMMYVRSMVGPVGGVWRPLWGCEVRFFL